MRVTSHTADPLALTAYGPLTTEDGRLFTARWVGDGVVEMFQHVDGAQVKIRNRTAAEALTNVRLFVDRALLPAPGPDEYYYTDLIGLAAVDAAGAQAGVIAAVHDYGAGVSLDITTSGGGSLVVPFTEACVPRVDLTAGVVVIDPPAERIVENGAAA